MKLTKFALFVMIFLVVIGFVFGATCGDGKCDEVENCNNCPDDCACVEGKRCVYNSTKDDYECKYVCDNNGTCETDTGENCMGCKDCYCGGDELCMTYNGIDYSCTKLKGCGGYFCKGSCCDKVCFGEQDYCCVDGVCWGTCTCVMSVSNIQPTPNSCDSCTNCDTVCCNMYAIGNSYSFGQCNNPTPPNGYYCKAGLTKGFCNTTIKDDIVCYLFKPKAENGESCPQLEDECCLSNACVDGVCCESKNPPGDKCDADNDGLACGRWSCATGFWECVDDVVIQSFPTGRYTSDDLSFNLPREVTWKKITLYGEIDDGQINVKWKTDKVASYSNPVSFTTIDSSGSTITLDEPGKSISIKIDFLTNNLSKTPILKKIIFVSSPRLTNTTQIKNSLEGQCWPISISQSTSVEHNPNYKFTTTDCQGPTNASAKIGLTTTEYSENNYSDNKQTIDIGGCFE